MADIGRRNVLKAGMTLAPALIAVPDAEAAQPMAPPAPDKQQIQQGQGIPAAALLDVGEQRLDQPIVEIFSNDPRLADLRGWDPNA